jgi:pimeloyl-ACP methyl ester carboxylesterase
VGSCCSPTAAGTAGTAPRNRYVAQMLNEAKLATLLVDLLTSNEESIDLRTAHLRFDIGLLAERLVGATDWLTQYPDTRHRRVGYFGARTGGAAALVAAAERPDVVGAVVSRGGRPDSLPGRAISIGSLRTTVVVTPSTTSASYVIKGTTRSCRRPSLRARLRALTLVDRRTLPTLHPPQLARLGQGRRWGLVYCLYYLAGQPLRPGRRKAVLAQMRRVPVPVLYPKPMPEDHGVGRESRREALRRSSRRRSLR